jgi:hypothetical protein
VDTYLPYGACCRTFAAVELVIGPVGAVAGCGLHGRRENFIDQLWEDLMTVAIPRTCRCTRPIPPTLPALMPSSASFLSPGRLSRMNSQHTATAQVCDYRLHRGFMQMLSFIAIELGKHPRSWGQSRSAWSSSRRMMELLACLSPWPAASMAGVVADLLLVACVERVASPAVEDSMSAALAEGFPGPGPVG